MAETAAVLEMPEAAEEPGPGTGGATGEAATASVGRATAGKGWAERCPANPSIKNATRARTGDGAEERKFMGGKV